MPNYIENLIKIEVAWDEDDYDHDSNAKKLKSLERKLKSEWGDIDFNGVVKSPKNKESGDCNREHADGVVCWYEWNTENWGVKWNAGSPKLVKSDDFELLYYFETAWTPPYPIYNKLIKMGYEVSGVYHDEGDGEWHTLILNAPPKTLLEESEAGNE